jgi:branched-chain amino acid transport system substrate-binding protein
MTGPLGRLAAIATVIVLLVAPGARSQAADPPPYVIPAVLSLTGPYAFVGQADQQALRVFEAYTNAHGGIRGAKLHFEVEDDRSNPSDAVSLTTQLIARNPPVILGSNGGSLCNAMAPLFHDGPVLYCFVPSIYPAKGSYVFASQVALNPFIDGMIRYLRLRGLDRIAVISSTDGSGQADDIGMRDVLALPENKDVKIVTYEHFNPTDLNVTAQATHIKASDAQAVIVWASGTSFGTVLRSFNDVGIALPVETSNANLHANQLAQYLTFYPKELVMPGLPYMIPASAPAALGPSPAMKKAIVALFDAYKMNGALPDPGAASGVWDPVTMIVEGARKIGPGMTAAQLRDFLLGIHGDFSGIYGDYDFSRGDQHGLSDQAVVMASWDPKSGAFYGVSGLHGVPLPAHAP